MMRSVLFSILLGFSSVAMADEATAPIPWPNKLAIIELARGGELDALEAELSGLQAAFEAGRLDERAVDAAFSAFFNSDPSLGDLLDRWVRDRPDSTVANLARAYHYWYTATVARGSRWGRLTPAIRFERMRVHLERAEVAAEQAIALNPRLSLGYAMLIRIRGTGSDHGPLELLWREGLQHTPGSLLIRHAYFGKIENRWGGTQADREAAMAEVEAAVEAYPSLRPLLGYRAYYLARSASGEEAVALYDQALSFGDYWWFHYRRGLTVAALGRHREAIADHTRALAVRPQVATVLESRGDAYRALDNDAAALADVNAALRLDPFHPIRLTDRAKLHRRADRFDDALSDLDRALIHGDHDFYVRAERGLLFLYDLEDYQRAAEEWRRATELNPDRASYWYHYGLANYHLLDCDIVPALDTYVELCEADPGRSCDQTRVTWAEEVTESLIDHGECPQRCSGLSRIFSLCG